MKKKNQFIAPYLHFSSNQWSSSFNKKNTIYLTEKNIKNLKKINQDLSIEEIYKIYLPLAQLLNCYIISNINKQNMIKNIFETKKKNIPYIISIAGSVAAGKSTTASILKVLLSLWKEHQKVELITTDSFLHPNYILKKKGLMQKKGFPQSYNINCLFRFLSEVKSGSERISIPIYSHMKYDIVPNIQNIIKKPDILIIEGLNVLQSVLNYLKCSKHIFISDFFDFSIYVHASESLLAKWFIDRFLKFRKCKKIKKNSYFNKYLYLSEKKAVSLAMKLWEKINYLNLKKHILPTKERANLILIKSKKHIIKFLKLKK